MLNTTNGGKPRGHRRTTTTCNLHIVQGGIDNGDKNELKRLSQSKRNIKSWIAPKNAAIGDDVVIYIAGFGFFATAKINSTAIPRTDWPNRYGAGLRDIKLIKPPISLLTIQRKIPGLTWANYPRSINTPTAEIAGQVRKLIKHRRRTGLPDLDDETLSGANLDELRKVARMKVTASATMRERKVIYRARSRAIHFYVLRRADGICEGCQEFAPFRRANGSPYLEPHHTTRLADDGPDHPAHVIALCPTCHRRAHSAEDAKQFNARLKQKLRRLERK